MPGAKPRRHWLFALLVILVVLILGTGGAAAYVYLFPERSVSSALAELEGSKKLNMTVRFDLDSKEGAFKNSSAEVIGTYDRSSATPRAGVMVSATLPEGTIAGELRFVDNTIYGKLISFPAEMNAEIKEAMKLWYSISVSTLGQMIKEYESQVPQKTAGKLRPAPVHVVYERLHAAGVIGDPVFTGFGKRDGMWVRTYTMTIDKSALVEYLIDLAGDDLAGQREAIQKQAESSMEMINFKPIVANVSFVKGTLVSVSGGVQAGGMLTQATRGVRGLDVTVTNNMVQSDFAINVPEGAIAIDEYVLRAASGREAMANNARVQANLANIRAAAELYYDKGSSYSGVCTKSAQVQQSIMDIKSVGSVPVCKATARSYIFTSSLAPVYPATTTTYFCVDSLGGYKVLGKIPTGYVCK